jgi:signal transduction histidine kinase
MLLMGRTLLDSPGAQGRQLLRWPLIALIWTGIAVMVATQSHFYESVVSRGFEETGPTWSESFRYPLVECLFWALLTPLILWLADRFPPVSARWLRNISLLIFVNAGVELVHALYRVPSHGFVYPRVPVIPAPRLFRYYLLGNALNDVWIFWTILGVGQVVASFTHHLDREKELSRAQLQALTAQLQPHFLFNVLNSVSSLMREDADAADEMIERLSDLMRTTLKSNSPQEVSLGEELQVVNQYIAIEQMRFCERLTFYVQADDEARAAAVPTLLLLPIVENAVRYAIAPRTCAGRIDVEARRVDRALALRVKDDGPGIHNGQQPREGIGLSSTRTRLHRYYGDTASLAYHNIEPAGFAVEMRLPFRRAGDRGSR